MIDVTMEAYVDDMLVKSVKGVDHPCTIEDHHKDLRAHPPSSSSYEPNKVRIYYPVRQIPGLQGYPKGSQVEPRESWGH